MYIPGYPPPPFPLSRHLPPLGEGVAAAYAEQFSAPGDLVIDPFGQTPRVALELARAGRRVIVANANPVLRFALQAALDPVPSQTLRTVLTRLADSPLANDRLETYLRRQYRSTCPDCGGEVEVDAFFWEREALVEKSYHCETCGAERTRPVDAADTELAARVQPRGPHYHWALEHIAPADDSDRSLFSAALDAYTPRALNLIFTLTHKGSPLEIDAPQRRALQLLLLMAYDEGASLDGQRPRSLKRHVRFAEKNIWLTLERLVKDEAWQSAGGPPVPVVSLPELLNSASPGVAFHEGSVRDLAAKSMLPPKSVPCMITALPRPNLVLWALSTAWAGWLWGEPAARPIRQLIRRRRYDWAWHENALRSGFTAAHSLLSKGSRLVALLPEAEAGFTGAALTAADSAGFTLIRHALRSDPAEAQYVFQPDATVVEPPDDLMAAIRARAEEVVCALLRERGEPSRWTAVSGAIFVSLAHDHLLRLAADETVADPFDFLTDMIEAACWDSRRLVDLRTERAPSGEPEPEGELVKAANAWWWLMFPAEAKIPLADRVEREVTRALAATIRSGADRVAIERRVCEALPGLTAPDGNLIRRCLESYGVEREGLWFFRPEDNPLDRASDFAQIIDELAALGRRLGYDVESKRSDQLEWRRQPTWLLFFITDTAEIAPYLYAPAPGRARRIIVIPGGRSGLIAYKLKRDPRLRAAVEEGEWLFLKFRHLRRLLEEPSLNLADLSALLGRDPIVDQTPTQLPLL